MSSHPSSETPMTKYHSYPKPEAEYQQIVQSPDFFLQKLREFHLFFANNFKVPTVGGSSLDLHRLFLEVTSRGGIEKVIRDRRWKEVTAAFKFPTSITSASFILRKFYLSLLYHFEQVYYLRKDKPSLLPAGENDVEDDATFDELSGGSNLEDGSLVTGIIDGKFDDGYLVTVKLGSEDLKGVLYHIPVVPDLSQSLSTSDDPVPFTRRKHQTARDPTHPKRNRSGYTFFFAEQYQRLRSSYVGQERAISKKIGQLWSNLSEAEKQVYQEKGLRDKERYRAEMSEYKSSQHVQG